MTVDFLPITIDSNLAEKVHHSFDVLEQCLTKYSPNQIAVAFNGGKDCTVVLHQYSLILQKKYSNQLIKPAKIRGLLILNQSQFESVTEFIEQCVKRYDLDLIKIHSPMKDALFQLKDIHPDIQCVIMGTRSTDPYSSNLNDFSPTDPSWPEYMRCNPILNYTYKDIWNYLREFNVPYCSIYDQGFTSLGAKERTRRNSNLQYQNHDTGSTEYKPAYLLDDECSERRGRE